MWRLGRLRFSRKMRVLAALVVLAAGVTALQAVTARGLPETGILVLDLRQGLPDKTEADPDGRRSVSALDVLCALDAVRTDARISGLYLRVGGGSMALAQASEIADAVMRVRSAGKFAVVWSAGFAAQNLSDRVLASAADEIWTGPQAEGASGGFLLPPPEEIHTPPFESGQAALWRNLLNRASERIALAAEGATGSVDAVASAGGPPPPQLHSGPEARAEEAALAWGGAGAGFVDLLTYREVLDRGNAHSPIVAVVQAEGVLDILEGPGVTELAGPLADRIRTAAADPRVKGVIVRISAVSASDESLALLARAAGEARRAGIPAGFSFGPLVPVPAVTLQAEIPVMAPGAALVVDPASVEEAALLAERARFPWRLALQGADPLPAEGLFLQRGAALATVDIAGGTAEDAVPEGHSNPLDGGAEGETASGRAAMWRGEIGTLLELKDRLPGADAGPARGFRLVPYEAKASVWVRTKARFAELWRYLSALELRELGGN